MKKRVSGDVGLFGAMCILAALLFGGCAPAEMRTISLFDGRTFDGWEGNLDHFRIQDGAIVGGSLEQAIPRNEFLCTEKVYRDFELSLKVRLAGDPATANAGIQIRSRRTPNNNDMIGYQADMGQHYWACLYDEGRRHRILAFHIEERADARILLNSALLNMWTGFLGTFSDGIPSKGFRCNWPLFTAKENIRLANLMWVLTDADRKPLSTQYW
jgi:hypothetical protein